MIELDKLPILNRFHFLQLSSRITENKDLFPGEYILHRRNKGYNLDYEYIQLLPDGKIGETNLDVRGYPWGWSVKIHEGLNMATQNSFDVKGLSTMEIIYADEKIIYALGHCKEKHLFIRKEYENQFVSNDDLLLYFAKIENNWIQEQIKLKWVTYHIDKYLDFREPLGFWIPAIISLIICGLLSRIEQWYWVFLVGVFPLTMWLFRTILKYRRRYEINMYKVSHPEDKVANAKYIDAFDFD